MGHVVDIGARQMIGTSWKMNLVPAQARAYLADLRTLAAAEAWGPRTVFVLPPYVDIEIAREELKGSRILYGAQNVHHAKAGAFTGEVSAPMLAALGCQIVEVGHSERRRDQHETDELIGAKVAAILSNGMWPLVCVGESGQEHEDGLSAQVVLAQLERIFEHVSEHDAGSLLVAYEPWWAIGVGATAAPLEHVARLHAVMGEWLSQRWHAGDEIPVLYGGSVDLDNAAALLATPGVDGLFVGRAALDPATFAAICRAGMGERGAGD
ncbi:MAG TPA: triose-phosphate isomerase [Candidatus Limnocylindrales bacterium]